MRLRGRGRSSATLLAPCSSELCSLEAADVIRELREDGSEQIYEQADKQTGKEVTVQESSLRMMMD